MSELIQKLGLNWKLLLAQTVNFLLVLTILRLTVYKPLVRMLHERRRKIEQGMQDAEEAGKRLSEAERVKQEKLAEAEQESLALMKELEVKAKTRESELLQLARTKEGDILKNAEKVAEAKRIEALQAFYGEAAELVKRAVTKTVELDPKAIDEALVAKAVEAVKQAR